MQVFSLLGHVIRSGRVVLRLLDAETANIGAARRREAVARWRRAIADGLTASAAAKTWAFRALGEQSRRRSSRPHRRRWKNGPSALMQAVERLRRADELTAMWVTVEGH
jgi:putative transposase